MSSATVKRIGLFGGPLLGLPCYYLLRLAGILVITALITLFIAPLLGNESRQSSKLKEEYSKSVQAEPSLNRIGGRSPDEK
jgi:hypothetical protein